MHEPYYYQPEKWMLIQFPTGIKLCASWTNEAAAISTWSITADIVRTEEDGEHYIFHGPRGSAHKCLKDSYGGTDDAIRGVDSLLMTIKEARLLKGPEELPASIRPSSLKPPCGTCGGTGLTEGWTPTREDPDNVGGVPSAEPCPDCKDAPVEPEPMSK